MHLFSWHLDKKGSENTATDTYPRVYSVREEECEQLSCLEMDLEAELPEIEIIDALTECSLETPLPQGI